MKVEFIKWFSKKGIPQLHNDGFLGTDIREVNELVKRKVEGSFNRDEVYNYITDIKTLING